MRLLPIGGANVVSLLLKKFLTTYTLLTIDARGTTSYQAAPPWMPATVAHFKPLAPHEFESSSFVRGSTSSY
jgi:hypothetical protein